MHLLLRCAYHRVIRHRSMSTASLGISCIGLHANDIETSLSFYKDACGLPRQYSAHEAQTQRYYLGSFNEPGLCLLPSLASSTESKGESMQSKIIPETLIETSSSLSAPAPYLTVAVSNLRTSMRHAHRFGGIIGKL